jgi:hypothetical protein
MTLAELELIHRIVLAYYHEKNKVSAKDYNDALFILERDMRLKRMDPRKDKTNDVIKFRDIED